MASQPIRLTNTTGSVVADVRVQREGDYYSGSIVLDRLPPATRAIFDEYEEVVNGQVLSLLDQVEGRVAGLGLRVLFDNGSEGVIEDLQVYPRTQSVSFKVVADRPSPTTVVTPVPGTAPEIRGGSAHSSTRSA